MASGVRQGPSRSTRLVMAISPSLSVFMWFPLRQFPSPIARRKTGYGRGGAKRQTFKTTRPRPAGVHSPPLEEAGEGALAPTNVIGLGTIFALLHRIGGVGELVPELAFVLGFKRHHWHELRIWRHRRS